MAIIPARNTLHETASKTRLTHDEASGVTVLRWENPNGFNANWGIQIGETGNEQTEVRVLSSATPAGTAGTITAATDFEHPADTPIYAIKYDQVVFLRDTAGTTSSTALTNGTITYQADGTTTVFDDTTGASTYGYQTLFRSSGLSSNSTLSDWTTFAGFDFYTLGAIRQRAKDKLWDPKFIGDDSVWDNWINEWKDEMANEVIQSNEDYALGTAEVAFGTDGLGTLNVGDFSQVRRVWVKYNATDTFRSTKMSINDLVPNQIFSGAHPFHAWKGDNILQVFPSDISGTADLVYYQFGTTLVNDTDSLPQAMRPYTKSFVDYCVAQALYKDQKDQSADRKLAEAVVGKNNFLLNLSPRDKSGPTYISVVNPISGDDMLF